MADEVKPGEAKRPRGIGRHFEGWPLAIVAVGIAVIAALLAVPRPVPPDVLPLPVIDHRELGRVMRAQASRAAQVRSEALSFDVRSTGEAFRAHGAAAARGDGESALRALREFRGLAMRVREREGDEPLLRLRAIQTALFTDALARFQRGENVQTEVAELGGNFLDKATTAHWRVGERRLVPTELELSVLFRLRWTELAGLREERAFAPSLEEWKLYYRFLLRHPEHGPHAHEDRLAYITALRRVDLDYPVLLARGVVLYQMGQYAAAEQALRAHIVAQPKGRWRLRAQNHLAAAVARVREGGAAPL